jgi:hypothetical protein
MVIVEIKPDDVIAECRETLGLPPASKTPIDDTLLAALLRRSAGIHCPCSRATLRASLLESLQYLSPDAVSLSERIDGIIEGLMVGGDLLELNDVTTEDPAVRGTWVFAAPPSYIVRPGGSVFLTGIVADQDAFLPQLLAARTVYEGFTRVISPEPDEDLSGDLREQGLQSLSESVWLKSPKAEAAGDMLSVMERRLEAQPPSGAIKDLQILDPAQPVTYYRGRWTGPKGQNGNFVSRRPQEYGAPIWCFAQLEAGAPVRFLDLPLRKSRWRGCDAAWHLQMAIDYCRHNPQLYRRRRVGDNVRFDFFSPLPEWSQRRLMIFGRPAPRTNCLMSYQLSAAEAETEERFLQERLWLSRSEDSD